MDIKQIVDKIPDYGAFLTVEEMDESSRKLADQYPNVVVLFEAGVSRQGHPILGLKIGNGPLNALCFACPHPNEPIGAMTMEFFSRELAENKALRDELGFTWYIIKCIDPDGVRLNEGWFKGPYSIYNYMKHYYRPIGYEQVEWTFPIDYKELHFHDSLPETKALMNIMDETSPAFMYSLHNAGFGGAYWYISKDMPELYDALHRSASRQEVALNLGEPEAPYLTEFAPAVFQTMSARQEYDYTEQNTGRPPAAYSCGTSSGDYASSVNPDCVTLLTELPYFFDARVQDLSEADITRREAIYQNVDMCNIFFAELESMLEEARPYINRDGNNPFIKLVDQSLRMVGEIGEAKKSWADSQTSFNKPAKVAHVFDNLLTAKFYNGLALGLAVRSCEFELKRFESSGDAVAIERLEQARRNGAAMLVRLCEELEEELHYSVIPIRKLVSVQVESGLIVAAHISGQRQAAGSHIPTADLTADAIEVEMRRT
ncbi:M14 family zinc carboxypeptidase [Cohnella sp.]|uniref:M14 family zinc carboxypeptidase n=1 Tax=Cohnella sp. TaxID=1883426 RepID=UPI003566DDA4